MYMHYFWIKYLKFPPFWYHQNGMHWELVKKKIDYLVEELVLVVRIFGPYPSLKFNFQAFQLPAPYCLNVSQNATYDSGGSFFFVQVLYKDPVTGIDIEKQTLTTNSGKLLKYGSLIVATGCTASRCFSIFSYSAINNTFYYVDQLWSYLRGSNENIDNQGTIFVELY